MMESGVSRPLGSWFLWLRFRLEGLFSCGEGDLRGDGEFLAGVGEFLAMEGDGEFLIVGEGVFLEFFIVGEGEFLEFFIDGEGVFLVFLIVGEGVSLECFIDGDGVFLMFMGEGESLPGMLCLVGDAALPGWPLSRGWLDFGLCMFSGMDVDSGTHVV